MDIKLYCENEIDIGVEKNIKMRKKWRCMHGTRASQVLREST